MMYGRERERDMMGEGGRGEMRKVGYDDGHREVVKFSSIYTI